MAAFPGLWRNLGLRVKDGSGLLLRAAVQEEGSVAYTLYTTTPLPICLPWRIAAVCWRHDYHLGGGLGLGCSARGITGCRCHYLVLFTRLPSAILLLVKNATQTWHARGDGRFFFHGEHTLALH